jgi:hypothetical protein
MAGHSRHSVNLPGRVTNKASFVDLDVFSVRPGCLFQSLFNIKGGKIN